MKLKPSESQIQRAIMDLLAAEHIFALRINTSGVVVEDGRGGRRLLRSHSGGAGVADIIAVIQRVCGGLVMGTKVLWIEVKSETGKQTPEQANFANHVRMHSMYYLLARSVEDVLRWIEEHR